MERVSGEYLFKETAAAARRLGMVAGIFEAPSRDFLVAAKPAHDLGLAVDLGCGPGHTTGLLAETLRPRRTVGIDRAHNFLELAREAATGTAAATGTVESAENGAVEFVAHDVTETPFPVGPADLLYCRFLLTHLTGHAELLAAWATQLNPGGRVLLDEVEWIQPGEESLERYLAALGKVLDHQGHRLEIGPVLDDLPVPDGLRRLASDVRTTQPPAARAAEMFRLNLTVWGAGEAARSLVGQAELDRIAAGLDALAHGEVQGEITWGLRQIVYERAV
jgi:trans-aconitate 2-methyltransferase